MFIPVQNNEINEPPYQMITVICSDYSRIKICARFAKNIKRTITGYKKIIRSV